MSTTTNILAMSLPMDLHNSSRSGPFYHEQMFELRDLESLNVSSNNFIGQLIPDQELGLLKKLIYHNLSRAGFASTIPWHVGNLSSSTVFNLTSSEPSMLASPYLSWVENLTALKHISLDRADLSATSSSWGQLTSPIYEIGNLSMSNYGLTGSNPPPLQNLASLQILHLPRNTFQTEYD